MLGAAIGVGLVAGAAWMGREGGARLDGWTAQQNREDLQWLRLATSQSAGFLHKAEDAVEFSASYVLNQPAPAGGWSQNPRSILSDPCVYSRNTYVNALDRLKKSRRYSRSQRAGEIVSRYLCQRNYPTDREPVNRIELICHLVNVMRLDVDRGIAHLKQARANHGHARRKGWCPRSLPKVPLSGVLDKPVRASMPNPDFVDEMVYRASEFSRATENTYRELYNEADPDEANNPDCPSARGSYAQAVDRRRDSAEAVGSKNARRLNQPCSSKTGVGRSEMCRRFRWAQRKHEGADCSFRELKAEVERYCR